MPQVTSAQLKYPVSISTRNQKHGCRDDPGTDKRDIKETIMRMADATICHLH